MLKNIFGLHKENKLNAEMPEKDISLTIDAMGIVIYSNEAMSYVAEGEDFLNKEFWAPEKVAEHIKKGDIIGFNLGSSGNYNLHIRSGYPDEEMIQKYPKAARLAIDVKGQKVSFADLFWLMEWSKSVPEEQTIELKDGIYHVTVLTNKPDSGIIGDNQDIYIYFEKLDEMPKLTWEGVPGLY